MERSALETMIRDGATQREIAARLDCSQASVRYWLQRHGLTTANGQHRRGGKGLTTLDSEPAPAPKGPLHPSPPTRTASKDTCTVGATTESAVLARLTELGFACYVPFGVGKADLVIETSDGLKSVQCKTGRLSADGSIINFRTNTVLRSGETQDYRGAVDYFAVCAKGVSGVFLLRVDSVPRWQCHLRLRPSNNGQVKGVLPAEMYRI